MPEPALRCSGQASQAIYRELESLSRLIAAANAEIVAIRPKDICDAHLPGAADELDAVVWQTEQATGTIFSAVESIEGALPEMPPQAAARVTEAVTRIYEACGFQDITGQRIAKVMRALVEVQRRVGALLVGFGDSRDAATDQAKMDALPASAPAANGGLHRQDGAVALDGPPLPKHAPTQAEVDALLDRLG
ncbi:MAG: protein phosphatase CheZ [Rhodospirillaceae bacterium]|nr:protein phosphatase CheZ [Rhodospirillaceae bacterium]